MVGATEHCPIGIIHPKKSQMQKANLMLKGCVANIPSKCGCEINKLLNQKWFVLRHRVWKAKVITESFLTTGAEAMGNTLTKLERACLHNFSCEMKSEEEPEESGSIAQFQNDKSRKFFN